MTHEAGNTQPEKPIESRSQWIMDNIRPKDVPKVYDADSIEKATIEAMASARELRTLVARQHSLHEDFIVYGGELPDPAGLNNQLLMGLRDLDGTRLILCLEFELNSEWKGEQKILIQQTDSNGDVNRHFEYHIVDDLARRYEKKDPDADLDDPLHNDPENRALERDFEENDFLVSEIEMERLIELIKGAMPVPPRRR